MNILEKICANKRREVQRWKESVAIPYLIDKIESCSRPAVSFKQSLADSSTGIIAEFKRRSPSKGWINKEADPAVIASGYEKAGAAAVSCLTDEEHFGGSFRDFEAARHAVKHIPLLRKDFIVDEYQIYQSKAMGADVILLIAACLSKEECTRFTSLAHKMEMEVLLEIHNREELEYISGGADVIGINNRNLKTFATDINQTIELAGEIPEGYIKISESGIRDAQTVINLRKEGFRGFLMGENFMKTSDPAAALKEFIGTINSNTVK